MIAQNGKPEIRRRAELVGFFYWVPSNNSIRTWMNSIIFIIFQSEDFLNLIDRCLCVDPNERADTDELLNHPFIIRFRLLELTFCKK